MFGSSSLNTNNSNNGDRTTSTFNFGLQSPSYPSDNFNGSSSDENENHNFSGNNNFLNDAPHANMFTNTTNNNNNQNYNNNDNDNNSRSTTFTGSFRTGLNQSSAFSQLGTNPLRTGGSLGTADGALGTAGRSLGTAGGALGTAGRSLGTAGGSLGATGGSLGATGGSLGTAGGALGTAGGSLGTAGGSLGTAGGAFGATGGSLGATGGSTGNFSGYFSSGLFQSNNNGSSESTNQQIPIIKPNGSIDTQLGRTQNRSTTSNSFSDQKTSGPTTKAESDEIPEIYYEKQPEDASKGENNKNTFPDAPQKKEEVKKHKKRRSHPIETPSFINFCRIFEPAIRKTLPELPDAKVKKYLRRIYKCISEEDAERLSLPLKMQPIDADKNSNQQNNRNYQTSHQIPLHPIYPNQFIPNPMMPNPMNQFNPMAFPPNPMMMQQNPMMMQQNPMMMQQNPMMMQQNPMMMQQNPMMMQQNPMANNFSPF